MSQFGGQGPVVDIARGRIVIEPDMSAFEEAQRKIDEWIDGLAPRIKAALAPLTDVRVEADAVLRQEVGRPQPEAIQTMELRQPTDEGGRSIEPTDQILLRLTQILASTELIEQNTAEIAANTRE